MYQPSMNNNHNAGGGAIASGADGADGIVNKLHDAINAFRREKDVARRERDLTIERFNVTSAERQVEETKTAGLQAKLDEINRKVAGGNRDELAKKQAEVERLAQETNFQHAELLRKREKMSTLETKMTEEANKRNSNIHAVRRAVKIWREKCSVTTTTTSSFGNEDGTGANMNEAEQLKLALSDVEDRGGEDYMALLMKLPELIEKKAKDIMADADDICLDCESLGAINDRYRTELGLSAAGNDVGGQANPANAFGAEQQQPQETMMTEQPMMMEQPIQQPIEAAYM